MDNHIRAIFTVARSSRVRPDCALLRWREVTETLAVRLRRSNVELIEIYSVLVD
jgi:hypothetical protein